MFFFFVPATVSVLFAAQIPSGHSRLDWVEACSRRQPPFVRTLRSPQFHWYKPSKTGGTQIWPSSLSIWCIWRAVKVACICHTWKKWFGLNFTCSSSRAASNKSLQRPSISHIYYLIYCKQLNEKTFVKKSPFSKVQISINFLPKVFRVDKTRLAEHLKLKIRYLFFMFICFTQAQKMSSQSCSIFALKWEREGLK